MDRLPHIDPLARRGSVRRAYLRMFGTRAAGWLSRAVVWRLDPIVMRRTGGRVGFAVGMPTALLETLGARTGLARRHAVIYFHDGGDVVVVASHLGLPRHPAWFYNAVAHPDVTLNGVPFRAEVVTDGDERDRLWALADRVFPPFARYRDRAAASGRTIPLLRLTA